MSHIDRVFLSGNKMAIQAIKESFGMENVNHFDDVAGARTSLATIISLLI
jgi:UDP-N-acetylmuramyl pentapeptide synthase